MKDKFGFVPLSHLQQEELVLYYKITQLCFILHYIHFIKNYLRETILPIFLLDECISKFELECLVSHVHNYKIIILTHDI